MKLLSLEIQTVNPGSSSSMRLITFSPAAPAVIGGFKTSENAENPPLVPPRAGAHAALNASHGDVRASGLSTG